MEQTILVVDDMVSNLKVARNAITMFTEVGADVLLIDNAQVAFDLINDDKEENIIGVVTDLYFPKDKYFSGYDSFVHTVKSCAKRVFLQMGKVINDERYAQTYIARLPSQFDKLMFNVEQLPYGGGIALACIRKHIPFIILSDSGRHVLEGQPLDTATMYTPFVDMGFVGHECLTNKRSSRHTAWAAEKKDLETWRFAFLSLAKQWGEDIVFGKSTWASYCNPKEVRQPKIPMVLGDPNIKKGKVFGKVSTLCDGNKAIEHIAYKRAKNILKKSEHLSVEKYSEQQQMDFLKQVLFEMGQLDEEISNMKAQSKLWLPDEGNTRLPPHHWRGIHYRTDIGLVVAVSGETIDRMRKNGVNDNQLRFRVLVWKIGQDIDNPKCIHNITYWDFTDDLEPPEIKKLSANEIVIDQFYWRGTKYHHEDIVCAV